MFTILIHSSKTTRYPTENHQETLNSPALIKQANQLATYLKTLSAKQLEKVMNISPMMSEKTHQLVQAWQIPQKNTLPAIDLFLGDIYSGLQVNSFTSEDRIYANKHLYILSGMYGILKAMDEIQPYRLEMGYRFPANNPLGQNLYAFWGDAIAKQLPRNQDIINLSAVEYTKALLPYIAKSDEHKDLKVITPKFLTISPKTDEPVFVTVHTKIARGAFARWLIQKRIEDSNQLKEFNKLGYKYAPELSTESEPVYVASTFKGIGLSVRLS